MQFLRSTALRRASAALAAVVLVIGTGSTMAFAVPAPEPTPPAASSADNGQGASADTSPPSGADAQDQTDPTDPAAKDGDDGTPPRDVAAPAPTFTDAPSATGSASVHLAAADCVAWDIDGTAVEAGDHKVAADTQVTITATAGEGCTLTGQGVWTHQFQVAASEDPNPKPDGGNVSPDPADKTGSGEAEAVVPEENQDASKNADSDKKPAAKAEPPTAGAVSAPTPVIPDQLDRVNDAERPTGPNVVPIDSNRYVDFYITEPSVCGGMGTVQVFMKEGASTAHPPMVGPHPGDGFSKAFVLSETLSASVELPSNSSFIPGIWVWDGSKYLADPSLPTTLVVSGCPTVDLTVAGSLDCPTQIGSFAISSRVTNNRNNTQVEYSYSLNGGGPVDIGTETGDFPYSIPNREPGDQIVVFAQIVGGDLVQASAAIGEAEEECPMLVDVTVAAPPCEADATGSITFTVTNETGTDATVILHLTGPALPPEGLSFPDLSIRYGAFDTAYAGGRPPGNYHWTVTQLGSVEPVAAGDVTVLAEPCPVAAPTFVAPTCEAPTGSVTLPEAPGVHYVVGWESGSAGSPGAKLLSAEGDFVSGHVVMSGTLTTSSLLGAAAPISVMIDPALQEGFLTGRLGAAADGTSGPWSVVFSPIDPASCISPGPNEPVPVTGEVIPTTGPEPEVELASDRILAQPFGVQPVGLAPNAAVNPPVAVPETYLPYTGGSVGQLTALGLALVGAGLVLLGARGLRSRFGR